MTTGAEQKDERRAQAVEIRQRVDSGEDFGELAKQVSEAGTRDKGGLLGPLTSEDLAEVLVTAAFELSPGTVSEVIETPYGFHIIQVESRVESHVKPLDEIRDQLRTFLENRKYRAELETFLSKAREESEWCVKPKHQELLAVPGPTSCEKI